jgi:hypothetical protein
VFISLNPSLSKVSSQLALEMTAQRWRPTDLQLQGSESLEDDFFRPARAENAVGFSQAQQCVA